MRRGIPWSLSGRLLMRDWRSGEVLVLLAALVVAVAAMTAVSFFTDRVRRAVAQEAGEVLAADLRVESVQPLAEAYLIEARNLGMQTAEVVHFRSVIIANQSSSLADVRGATPGYPLRGEIQVADSLGGVAYPIAGGPPRGTVWAEPSLMARLGVEVGDQLEIGALQLEIGRTLEFRPDEGWRLMEIAPTVLLSLEDLNASGLIQPGSIVEYEHLFAGDPGAVAAMRTWLEGRLTAEEDLDDIRDARPEVRASLEQAERFLVLAALVCVLLGGVAVAMAARRFVARRLDTVALMKCVGARYADILRLNLWQLLMLVVLASVLGGLIGFLAQYGLTALLADFIEAALPPAALGGSLVGPFTALVVAAGFALPPLLQLGGVPPARVLRKDIEPPPLRYKTIYGAAGASVIGLMYYLFGDLELIIYVMGGAVVTTALLLGAGRLLVLLLSRMRGGVGVAWRYGVANVGRRGSESSVQVVAFGIGLMVLLLLTVVRSQLMVQWQTMLDDSAPNMFLINIQPQEVDELAAFLAGQGLDDVGFTPLARGRISHVNGVPVSEFDAPDPRARRRLSNEINLTWAADLPSDNEVIAGEWWGPDPVEPQLSLEEEILTETGLSLGDRLTYAIGGESLDVRVTSVRTVNWESFQPNFFYMFSPGAVEEYAHTYITSFRVGPEHRAAMLDLVRQFPAVSMIDIEAVLEQVKGAMDRAALAVQYVFLFTLAAGVMVLLAAIQATRDERMFESAVLRTLGARRATVLQGVAAEFTALGLLAGLLAAIGAGGIGYVLATQLFEIDYVPGAWLWLSGMLTGAVIVGVSGTLAVRPVVNASPVAVLRGG